MWAFFRDLRYGIRTLMKTPGSSAMAVLALALGIGATTQSFTIVNTVLIKPLPYQDSERLVVIWKKTPTQDREQVPPADFLDWRRLSQSFENAAAIRFWPVSVTESGEPEQVRGYQVSASFFGTLGMKAALGRAFQADEDQPGREHVVVLSHRFWQKRFGGAPGIIGQEMMLNQEKYKIIGVMPSECRFPRSTVALWTPLVLTGSQTIDRKDRSLTVVARIKPGVSFNQAESDIAGVARRIEELNRDTNAGHGAWLLPIRELILGPGADALITLPVATFLVLLLACANVANLLFAKGAARQKEVAIRLSVGASRSQLIRQFLIEGMALALIAGGLGILLANWGLQLLVSNIPTFISDVSPRLLDMRIDGESTIFTLCLSLLTVLIFSLSPALIFSKTDINSALKDGERESAPGRGRHRIRSILIVAEIGLAVILMTGAGLLFRSYLQLMAVTPGFSPQHVTTMEIPLSKSEYAGGRRVAGFYREALKNLESLPQVQSAGAIHVLPLGGYDDLKVMTAQGRPLPPPGQERQVHYRVVSPKYFQAQGLSLIKGQDFSDQDFENKPPVAIVSDSAARQFLQPGEPLGQHVIIEGESTPRRVIGVVGDVNDWDALDRSTCYLYVPYVLDRPEHQMTLVVRSQAAPGSLIPAMRAKVAEVDRNQPIANVKTMEQVIAETRSPQRLMMIMFIILAVISTILAAIGVYGLISYSVVQRTQEIGIRMALGATPREILESILKQGLNLILIGLGGGMIVALALTRGMATLIYGINLMDPLTYSGVALLMITIGALAIFIPAYRASTVKPIIALRYK
jgi:putative ABC transport system permease protein